MVDAYGEGASCVGESWSCACLLVGGREPLCELLVGIGDGCVVEVSADDDGVVFVAVDDGADAVGLCASVVCGFAEFVDEYACAAFDGLLVWVGDGVCVFFFVFVAEVVAFQMVVDDEQAVSVVVNPACDAVVLACGVVDVYGVAQEGVFRQYGYGVVLPHLVVCGVEPFAVYVEELSGDFLDADDVGIGCFEVLQECLCAFFAGIGVVCVVGDDVECGAVGSGVVGVVLQV